MLREHDHDRINPGIMLSGARGAAARPPAPDDFGQMTAIGAEAMAAMPAPEAKRSGEHRRIVAVEASDQRQDEASVGSDRLDRGESRGIALKAEEQLGISRGPTT